MQGQLGRRRTWFHERQTHTERERQRGGHTYRVHSWRKTDVGNTGGDKRGRENAGGIMDNGHARFFGLATLVCVAVTLQIMGCALFHNWWYVYSILP